MNNFKILRGMQDLAKATCLSVCLIVRTSEPAESGVVLRYNGQTCICLRMMIDADIHGLLVNTVARLPVIALSFT